MRAAVIAGLVAGLAGTPAAAQESDDWDFGEDPARNLSIAAVTFENFGVAVRCMDNNLSVVMSGLPTATGQRVLGYRMGDAAEADTLWISAQDSTTAFAVWPRSIGSGMSRGGRLIVDAPDGESVQRFAVELPASPQAVERVFQACGKELDPPEDEAPSRENMAGLVWRKTPEPSFPDRSISSFGMAAIRCNVLSSGRLRECTIESEFPEGSGFGRASTYAAHRTGQVALSDGSSADISDRRIAFVTRYATSGDGPVGPSGVRMPSPVERYNPGRAPNEGR